MPLAGEPKKSYDIVIIGAGLAGLTLSRQLLLYTQKNILIIDKRINPPSEAPQKYGESLVQCAGYYFSRVLDLEEYLLIHHYLKYNLRFYWTTNGLENKGFEDYSQSYARKISNVATYQLDRNLLEEYLLHVNTSTDRCEFLGGVRDVGVGREQNPVSREDALRLVHEAPPPAAESLPIVQQAADLPHGERRDPHRLPEAVHGQRRRQAGCIDPVRVATGALPHELAGIDEQDPLDVGRNVIVGLKGTSGRLERDPAGVIDLVEQVGPALLGIREPEVPFSFVRVRGRCPFTCMDICLVEV